MDNIKVAIVEDDKEWLHAMVCFLNNVSGITVVWTADNKDDAVEKAKTENTDVILMDINLTENKFDGIYAASEISLVNNTKIIMLTSLKDDEVIKNSFIAGAVNFISKSEYKRLPDAIRSTYYNRSPMEIVLKDYLRLKEEEQIKDLTSAEREILGLVEKGYTQSQIESELYKSERTIKNQISGILKKLGVKTSKDAVKKKKLRGLFQKKNDN